MNLTNVKRLLKLIETDMPANKRKLDTEKDELTAKLANLKSAVAGGDAKSVSNLAIARERLEQIPNEIKAVNDDYAGALKELRQELLQISYQCGRAKVELEGQIGAACDKFLEQFIHSDYARHEIIRMIIAVNSKVGNLNSLQNSFSMVQFVRESDSSTLISHAQVALRELQNV